MSLSQTLQEKPHVIILGCFNLGTVQKLIVGMRCKKCDGCMEASQTTTSDRSFNLISSEMYILLNFFDYIDKKELQLPPS